MLFCHGGATRLAETNAPLPPPRQTGISKAQTGFYTGIIESLFSLVQFIIMPFWGRLSDKVSGAPRHHGVPRVPPCFRSY